MSLKKFKSYDFVETIIVLFRGTPRIYEHTLIILNNMVLVTKYDSNSYLVLSAGDDHGIKGDDANGSTP